MSSETREVSGLNCVLCVGVRVSRYSMKIVLLECTDNKYSQMIECIKLVVSFSLIVSVSDNFCMPYKVDVLPE